jgi:hypothetical protein
LARTLSRTTAHLPELTPCLDWRCFQVVSQRDRRFPGLFRAQLPKLVETN